MGCCDKNKLPSNVRMVRNAVVAAARVVRGMVKGDGVLARPETVEFRMAQCVICDYVLEIHKHGQIFHRCRHKDCGCWLDGKYQAKTRLAAMFCPLPEPKWMAEGSGKAP